jgi:hypothetical protein
MGRRSSLRFYTAAGLLQDYMYQAQFVEGLQGGFATGQGAQPGSANDNPGPDAGWSPTSPYGVRASEVPLFPEYDIDLDGSGAATTTGTGSDLWLVDPNNLIWGVRRQIQVFREFKPKKDAIEYTMYTRVGANVENPSASVVVKNVAYRD